jgi:hypothetical protein
MKSLFLFCLVAFLSFQSFGQVSIDVNSEKEVMAFLTANKFRSEEMGDFPMQLEIEQLNNQPTLVLSNEHGKRKLFTNLTFQTAKGYGVVNGIGAEKNDFDIWLYADGHIVAAGMTFLPQAK